MKNFYILLALALSPVVAFAQDYAGTFQSVPEVTFPPTATEGPDVTSEGFVRFFNDDFSPITDGELTVSAVFVNSAYAADLPDTAAQSGADDPDPGLNFGITTVSDQPSKVYAHDERLEGVKGFYFTEDGFYDTDTGAPLDVSNLQGFNMLAGTEGLNDDEVTTDGTYLLGTLTFTFNRPVDYPVVHFTGIGGFFIGTAIPSADFPVIQYELAYNAQLEATSHPVTLLSGTTNTVLETDNTVTNEWPYNPVNDFNGTGGDEAGTGSLRIEGTNVTDVVFNVYVQGKPLTTAMVADGFDRWSSYDGANPGVDGPNFDDSQSYAGDQFHVGMTLPIFTFEGSVVIDNKLNGTTAGEDGVDDLGNAVAGGPYVSGSPDYEPLFAVLTNDEGLVVQVVPVDPVTGEFMFEAVIGNDYSVTITTDDTVMTGDAAPGAQLPTAYQTTEEEFVDGGADDTPDSVTNFYNVNSTNADGINTANLIIGISQNNVVLPIVLQSFTAEAVGTDAHLEWITASEENNSHFEVEASTDGLNFIPIATVESQSDNGFSQSELVYNHIDKFAIDRDELVYYRVKQVDYDGLFAYTPVRIVSFEGVEVAAKAFPNPAVKGQTVTVQAEGIETIEVYNSEGMLVKVIEEQSKVYSTSIATGDLASGLYIIVINGKENIKLVVQ